MPHAQKSVSARWAALMRFPTKIDGVAGVRLLTASLLDGIGHVAVQAAQIDGHRAGCRLEKQQADGERGPHVEMAMLMMMVHGHGHFQLAGGLTEGRN